MASKGSKGDIGRNELIRVGGNISVIAEMFGRDEGTVRRAIAKNSIVPIINAEGRELYPVRLVAPYLVDISKVVNIEEILKSTSLKKLPPELTKNFWDAANARKKFMEDDKQLWRTAAVFEVFVDVFNTLRQTVNSFHDTVEDETDLSPKQRALIQEMLDSLLEQMRNGLIDAFELYSPNEEEKERDEEVETKVAADE